jgi:hypothetical protein
VLWRPHGFAPLQNNFQGFVEAFTQELDSRDEAWILPVFYAGGTAPRGICSGDLVEALCAKGVKARLLDRYPPRVWLGKEDVLLIMGARDPDLPVFAARMGSSLRPHSNGFEGTPGDLRTCAFPAR